LTGLAGFFALIIVTAGFLVYDVYGSKEGIMLKHISM
jgi:hypothetical protein